MIFRLGEVQSVAQKPQPDCDSGTCGDLVTDITRVQATRDGGVSGAFYNGPAVGE